MKFTKIFTISFFLASLGVAEEVHDDLEHVAGNSAKQVNLFLIKTKK